jgi:hypothetical protein
MQAEALVRIMGGNQRTITGSIARVSADITREQQNSSQPATGPHLGLR